MICSRCQASVDGSDYPHWQKVCWPCKATLDAREDAARLKNENREIRTKQQLSTSSNWGIECSQSVAEIENEELRARVAELEAALITAESMAMRAGYALSHPSIDDDCRLRTMNECMKIQELCQASRKGGSK